ncbi:MAG: hypothetical protein ABR600_03575 [Actinomycetota bacterium]
MSKHVIGRSFLRAALTVSTVIVLTLGAVASVAGHGPAAQRARSSTGSGTSANVDLYRGLGSWVDIYEHSSFANPERAVAGMRANGVRTLYIETSNYKRTVAIKYLSKQVRFIEAAHAAGMKVVAWYLPGFRDLDKDLWRTMKAIRFRTPSGQGYDSFALDIEAPLVQDPKLRTSRLLELSQRIRAAVGSSYPLGAIIPSPRGMVKHPEYWPGFPYRELASFYNVFLPMTYFTWRVSGEQPAHAYTTSVVQIIRHRVGDRSVPIHVIGGISDESTQGEARGFVHAVREQGVLGGSYYAYHGTSARLWRELRRIPANPIQHPPLPVRIDYGGALGNIPGGDRTHPKDVVYVAGPLSGAQVLRVNGYDVQGGEVAVALNWHPVATLPAAPASAWSGELALTLPGRWANSRGPNVITFTAMGAFPHWRTWGVRMRSLSRV